MKTIYLDYLARTCRDFGTTSLLDNSRRRLSTLTYLILSETRRDVNGGTDLAEGHTSFKCYVETYAYLVIEEVENRPMRLVKVFRRFSWGVAQHAC